jgi:hypothetical protein
MAKKPAEPARPSPQEEAFTYVMRAFFPRLTERMLDNLYYIARELNNGPYGRDPAPAESDGEGA